jgi:hypothetical protein
MTPTELRQVINYLFDGRGGQTELARLVRCNDSTIRRYLSGTREIPDYLVVILAHIYERKRSGLPMYLDVDKRMEEMFSDIRKTQPPNLTVLKTARSKASS